MAVKQDPNGLLGARPQTPVAQPASPYQPVRVGYNNIGSAAAGLGGGYSESQGAAQNAITGATPTSGYSDQDLTYANVLDKYLNRDNYGADSQGIYNTSRGLVRNLAGTTRDTNAIKAAEQAFRSRSKVRQGLSESINGSDDQLNSDLNLNQEQAGASLDSGLRKTRENYNNRGLLYSGMREGGEQGVRNNVASALAATQAGTRQDAMNTKNARQQAMASIGLQNNAQDLQAASDAFDRSQQNKVARMQAIQQFGEGVGSLAGRVYSANSNSTPSQSGLGPTTSSSLQMPQLGSQFQRGGY